MAIKRAASEIDYWDSHIIVLLFLELKKVTRLLNALESNKFFRFAEVLSA